jgi:hypothetical protein
MDCVKALTLLTGLVFAGCQTAPAPGQNAEVGAAQARGQVCGFVADAAVILAILARGVPELSTGVAIAQAICELRNKRDSASGGGRNLTLAGVTVTGTAVN